MAVADFPGDLIRDIIVRLSNYKSLCRFQALSKSSFFWIADEIKSRDPKLVFVSSVSLFSADLNSPKKLKKLKKHPPPREILESTWDRRSWVLGGSCNGLILLTTSHDIIICRNFISEYQVITQNSEFMISKSYPKAHRSILYGIGYDSVNDDYKVVLIMGFYSESTNNGPTAQEIRVFSLRNNAWTSSQTTTSLPFVREGWLGYKLPVAVGSGIHWLAYWDYLRKTPPFVFTFDVTTDDFREIELPEKTKANALGELRGCLTVTHTKNEFLDIWVMKEYMVKESWTLLFRISMINWGGAAFAYARPLAFSRNGNKILLAVGRELLWYDPGNDKLDHLDIKPKLKNTFKTTICLCPTNKVFHCQSPSKLICKSWDPIDRKQERVASLCVTQNKKKRTI